MIGLDLFSGIGGISYALRGYVRPCAYCEIDPYCAAVLASRMYSGELSTAPIFPDVTRLRAEILPRGIEIIYGGFPCQDLSLAGRRAGLQGKRSGLFFEVVRLAAELKPQFVFLENVLGVRKHVPAIRAEFEALGYSCRDGFLSAGECGAPHQRMRWFFLAYLDGDTLRQQPIKEQKREGQAKPTNANSDGLESHDAISGTRQGTVATNRSIEGPRKQTSNANGITEKRATEPREKLHSWESEPAVVRLVHGVPHRVDAIRALGNSVVPQCARKAFEILMGLA